jgi:hypothetical protein
MSKILRWAAFLIFLGIEIYGLYFLVFGTILFWAIGVSARWNGIIMISLFLVIAVPLTKLIYRALKLQK